MTSIGGGAFCNCSNLTSVIIPDTVINIGDSAFYGCGISQINLPEGLENIEKRAFAECNLKAVTVPKTVLKTGEGSFSGCREITIYDSIEPDAKPYTEHFDDIDGEPNSVVGFIGIGKDEVWNDYEIIVRSAQTDEIKYKVWMGANDSQDSYKSILKNSWGKNASFNFSAVDNFFAKIRGNDHKIKVAINRLKYPEMLSESQKKVYESFLVKSAKEIVKTCIDNNDMETLLFCETFGVIKKSNIDSFLEYATEKDAIQFTAHLLEYKNTNLGGSEKKDKMPDYSL